jgi:hypothetical protein
VLTLRARAANAMSERPIRKTEATRSFDRLPLNALRVFEAVAARLGFVRSITGSEAAIFFERSPCCPALLTAHSCANPAPRQCDGIHASWPLIESNAENAILNTP